jgi:trehalose/maltose hydrolase-like predicted phosphorylase
MRTDGDVLSFHPTLPAQWKSYRFRVCYQDAIIEVRVNRAEVTLQAISGPTVTVNVYGKNVMLDAKGIALNLPGSASSGT